MIKLTERARMKKLKLNQVRHNNKASPFLSLTNPIYYNY